MATWKYSNLPEHEYTNARQALDKYNMSNVAYCCPDPSLFTFFEDLLIKAGA